MSQCAGSVAGRSRCLQIPLQGVLIIRASPVQKHTDMGAGARKTNLGGLSVNPQKKTRKGDKQRLNSCFPLYFELPIVHLLFL